MFLFTYRSLVVMLYMHANYIHMFVAHDTVVTFLEEIYRYMKVISTRPSILRCTLVVCETYERLVGFDVPSWFVTYSIYIYTYIDM